MAASTSSKRRDPRAAVDDLAEGTSAKSKLDAVSHAILSPFTSRKTDSNRLLSDRACPPASSRAAPLTPL